MSVELASDLWGEIKRYISAVDRDEAADMVVSLLIDHDYDVSEIKSAFKGDSYIKQALASHADHEESHDEDEDDEYYDDDGDDSWD